MKGNRFFWSARPAQAMLEAWLIGQAILFVLSRQVGIVSPPVLSNGLLFLCGTCGMWVVLRTRVPRGSWPRQGFWELAVGVALSLVMAIGLRTPAQLVGWEGIWLPFGTSNDLVVTLLLLGTGPGYVLARAGVRLWFLWGRLRRRRMLWAITHAHLALVVLIAWLGALGMFLLSPYSRVEMVLQPEPATLLTNITERLLHTIFPGMSIVIVMTGLTLLVLLPPSALFSYLVARRTTRRLETLVDTAQALRAGQYDARVEVVGQDEVAQLQADFNAMADDLEQTLHDLEVERDAVTHLLQSRRELVAGVSHELRTPVATIRATLESALKDRSLARNLPPALEQDLEIVENEVLRLQRLIDDLFTLSQAEAGGLALDCRPTDVAAVIQRMVGALAPLAWSSGRVEVVAELPSDLPPARADAARLEQVLANLVRNGIHHTPPGGIVSVVAAVSLDSEPPADGSSGSIIIQVRDTGEGITTQDLPHIWERFYRGENSRESGAGLGLALVKEMTEAMGGTVSVESTPGQGSYFTIKLPTV